MQRADLDRAFALAAGQVAAGDVPFAIVGVGTRDRVVRLEAFPAAGGPPLGVDAVCLLASITKPITATAVVRLAESGRFPLDAPLERWLPELHDAGLAPFSAWHVLTHTTGIEDIDLVDGLIQGDDRAALIRHLAARQVRPPGRAAAYATFTFDLLADAVECALDAPFEDVLHETVLDPLGMTDTTFDGRVAGERCAPVTVRVVDGVPVTPHSGERIAAALASTRVAGGGLWSTAGDLLRFGRAMLRGGELDGARVLGRPWLALMTREVRLDAADRSGGDGADALDAERYAMGWVKPYATTPGWATAFGHGGATGTRLWIDPGADLAFVFLTGLWGGGGDASMPVLEAVLGGIG